MKKQLSLFGITVFAIYSTIAQANTTNNDQSSSTLSVASDPSFNTCMAELKPSALRSGVSSEIFDRYTRNLIPDYSVLDKLNYQPEFSTPIWDYLSGLVDDERVSTGKQKLNQYQDVLRRVSAVYGVPAEMVVAVWGVESNFGDISGKYPLLQSLGTLSCNGRRQSYFRTEFFATLRILQRGDVTESQLKGSWAGAFGHTQFMPSTYERLAVDFDGDGRRDLVSSTNDALASTANFLKSAGWQTGMPWGFEVSVPNNIDLTGQSRRNKKPLSYWVTQGLTRIDGRPLRQEPLNDATPAGLFMPAGAQGPKFLVFKNFDAIYSYNAAESYALAIAYLSDRLSGKPVIQTAWPTDDPGTSRAERREIQNNLLAKGYDIGQADGLIGDKTKQAIQKEQIKMGLPPTGRAGQVFLNAIRKNNTIQTINSPQ
ncbi:lytic murein transglycosylase [Acinetobacter sp. B5B]|uniref:lytic murein transglycosylase n=1 Tax=Acinetobacter baretiae TaxID=2605383 RepID=UPI0018C2527D|nr:lytic murein transglycosylase [Acinetobacter baretiae]MBF7686332.1 lytic murein transglycosylase [Acinetobacter baretiae]